MSCWSASPTIRSRAPRTSPASAPARSSAAPGNKVAKQFEESLKAKGKPGYSDYKLYDHFPEAYLDLSNNRIDAVISSLSTLQIVMRDAPGKYKTVTGIQALKAYFGMAFRLDDKKMLAFVNEQLGEMKKSGELDKLQVKWFGSPTEPPNEVPKELP